MRGVWIQKDGRGSRKGESLVKISGFTFIHNGVEGGYPFIEAIEAVTPHVSEMVIVDMESTDETVQVLEKYISERLWLYCTPRIIEGVWTPGTAGRCLAANHALHTKCTGDVIWHFEADEVFSILLSNIVSNVIETGVYNISVPRLQVEQNFQRCRWYPEYVHRVFPKGTVKKDGHTTDYSGDAYYIDVKHGFLWDVTNCFRDDWAQRIHNQAELWGGVSNYMFVPYHATVGTAHADSVAQAESLLSQPQWTWKRSPFDLPDSLKQLVGVTSYREHLKCRGLL